MATKSMPATFGLVSKDTMQKYIVKTWIPKPKGKKTVQIQEVYMHAKDVDNLRKNLIAKMKNGKKMVFVEIWTALGNTGYGDYLGRLKFIPDYTTKYVWSVSKRGIQTIYDVSPKTGKISNARRL